MADVEAWESNSPVLVCWTDRTKNSDARRAALGGKSGRGWLPICSNGVMKFEQGAGLTSGGAGTGEIFGNRLTCARVNFDGPFIHSAVTRDKFDMIQHDL